MATSAATISQPADRVVFVQALLRLGGGLDVPLDQRRLDAFRDLHRQHGLAGAGLTLHQQRPLQRDGCVDGDLEVVGSDISAGAFETHEFPFNCRIDSRTGGARGARTRGRLEHDRLAGS